MSPRLGWAAGRQQSRPRAPLALLRLGVVDPQRPRLRGAPRRLRGVAAARPHLVVDLPDAWQSVLAYASLPVPLASPGMPYDPLQRSPTPPSSFVADYPASDGRGRRRRIRRRCRSVGEDVGRRAARDRRGPVRAGRRPGGEGLHVHADRSREAHGWDAASRLPALEDGRRRSPLNPRKIRGARQPVELRVVVEAVVEPSPGHQAAPFRSSRSRRRSARSGLMIPRCRGPGWPRGCSTAGE